MLGILTCRPVPMSCFSRTISSSLSFSNERSCAISLCSSLFAISRERELMQIERNGFCFFPKEKLLKDYSNEIEPLKKKTNVLWQYKAIELICGGTSTKISPSNVSFSFAFKDFQFSTFYFLEIRDSSWTKVIDFLEKIKSAYFRTVGGFFKISLACYNDESMT